MSNHADGRSRRSFLAGLSAASAALVGPFLRREAAAQGGGRGPLRLVVIQTPDGRPPATWLPKGTETNFTLGPAYRPFEPLLPKMVVLAGVDTLRDGGEPHCAGFVQWMTGVPALPTVNNYTAARTPSFDQILAKDDAFVGGTRFRSLQLAGDMTTNSFDISHRYMSWSGQDQPLPGEHRSLEIYKRLFELFDPAGGPEARAALERLVKRRGSVLDLVKRDWQRMSAVVPAAQRPNFEAHLTSIRQLETDLGALDATGANAACKVPARADAQTSTFPARYAANLEMMRLALACDMTRIVTFLSSPSTSNLAHKTWIPEMTSSAHHHNLSHGADVANLEKIGSWYSARIAEFLTKLAATPDGTGSVLDNSVVLLGSELAYGAAHGVRNVPFVLFGGAGGKLRGGRFLDFQAQRRSSNDLWVSVANLLGNPMTTFGDPKKCGGAVPGLA